jgi:hypothetical protein
MTAFERSTMFGSERISAAHRDWMCTGSRSIWWKPWHTLMQRAITPAPIAEACEVLRPAIADLRQIILQVDELSERV